MNVVEIIAEEQRPKIIDIKAARIMAIQVVYSYLISDSKQDLATLANDMVENWGSAKYFRFSKSVVNQEYLKKLLETVINNKEFIEQEIGSLTVHASGIAKVPKVVLAILEVAISEILRKNLHISIIINEYLNLTDYFNHKEDKAFIHSILDKVAKKYSVS